MQDDPLFTYSDIFKWAMMLGVYALLSIGMVAAVFWLAKRLL